MTIIRLNGLDVPEYLKSENFFANILKSSLNISTSIKIESVEFSTGTAGGGDNYASIIYRVHLRYSSFSDHSKFSTSMIVKCISYDGGREVFKRINVFQKEFIMYSEVIPLMEKLLSTGGLWKQQIAPKLLHIVQSPIDTFVFQDLNELQMATGDRTIGLDETHSRLVMQKIAKYHAASMLVARDVSSLPDEVQKKVVNIFNFVKRPDLTKHFGKSIFDQSGECEMRRTIFTGNISEMATLVEGWHGYEEIAKKLRRINENFEELCEKCVTPRDAMIRVLTHGDLWVNNCMFKYDQDIPVELMLIDFQMCFYSSPALDLHYFLNTSVQLPVLLTKRYHLLRIYYDAFASTLEHLKYAPIPTWEEMKQEIRSTEFYGFWAFEAILPLLSMDKDVSKDNSVDSFGNAEEASKKRQLMFTSKRYLDSIRHLLDRFDKLGILDV